MYFFLQTKQQLLNFICFFENPKWPDGSNEFWLRLEQTEPEWETDILQDLRDVTLSLDWRFQDNSRNFHLLNDTLEGVEHSQFLEHIVPTQSEMTDILGREYWEGENIELSYEERTRIFEARLESMETRELEHDGSEFGPALLTEGRVAREFAQESWLSPEMLLDLRAANFDGSQSWEDGEIIENYRDLADEITRLAEEEWIELSQLSAEKVMELYEARRVDPMDPNERDARWDVIDDGAGWHRFDPETPGLQTFRDGGDVVQVLPDGTYTRGWEVFSPPPGGPQAFPNYDGPAGAVDRNPWTLNGELMIREETLGTRRLAELYDQLSEEDKEQIDAIMEEGAEPFQMHPIAMSDGSLQFISNPTYEPDVNGDGVSSNEAVAYAQWHSLQLPSRAQTDAARQQAQVRWAMPTHNNEGVSAETQRQNTASQRAYLEQTIRSNGNVLVWGVTKIWAFDGGRQPWLNGGIQNLQTGECFQWYSTVHGPDYADYSQAAQFVHPLRIGSDGSLEWQV